LITYIFTDKHLYMFFKMTGDLKNNVPSLSVSLYSHRYKILFYYFQIYELFNF